MSGEPREPSEQAPRVFPSLELVNEDWRRRRLPVRRRRARLRAILADVARRRAAR